MENICFCIINHFIEECDDDDDNDDDYYYCLCKSSHSSKIDLFFSFSEACSIYKNSLKLKKSCNKVNPVKWWYKIVQFIRPG